MQRTVGGLAHHAVNEQAALLLERTHRMVEFGVEHLRRDVPAGGQVRVRVLGESKRRQRRPDLGDGRAAGTETQRAPVVFAQRSRHHTAPSVTAVSGVGER